MACCVKSISIINYIKQMNRACVLVAMVLTLKGTANRNLQPALHVVCPLIQGMQCQTHVSIIAENVPKNIQFRNSQDIQRQATSLSFSGKRKYHIRSHQMFALKQFQVNHVLKRTESWVA